MHGVAIK